VTRKSLWTFMGARTRRSLALLWAALLVFSLVAQSASFAAPAPALAVHDEALFELDGNVENQATPGDDWNAVYAGTDSAFETVFLTDGINGGNGPDGTKDKYFDGGSTKDVTDISQWLWTTVSQPQDKNDIAHAYAAGYDHDGDLIVYFGLDRYASNGAAQVGFWFLKGNFGLAGGPATGSFVGTHQDGDVLVQIDFENGGSNPVVRVYEWQGAGVAGSLALISTGGSCATAAAGDLRCAIASTSSTNPAWPFDDKFDSGTDNDIPAGGMVEGGINLTDLNLDDGCFASFLAETRSSPSEDSTLSDFAFGRFSLCATPTIETQVRQGDNSLGSVGTINKGESVFDRATLTGTKGVVEGSLKFFVCGPNASSVPNCATGGTQVGSAVTLAAGVADSASFTPASTGFYCFRAEYTPATGSKYLAASHTNSTTECFQVLPANVTISKTAAASPVSAGSNISFTISWGNSGAGAAFGVVVSDNLPTTAGLDWSISGSTGSGSTCSITGSVGAEVLTCTVGTIPGNTVTHGTVTLTSGTTSASCGTVNNTGSISSTNDGSGDSSASIVVQCPDVRVTKTPDGDDFNAGDGASFSIKVENLGPGTATNVSLSDSLPSGQVWALGTVSGDTTGVSCSVTGAPGAQTLSCTDGSMASGDDFTVLVTTSLDATDCGTINNTASVSASNEPSSATGNNSDPGSIDVLCADIDIEKVADDATVNAGDDIGFTITVTNNGGGDAYGVEVEDVLPLGFDWAIDAANSDTGWSIVAGELLYGPASLAAGASVSVHITAPTDAEDCGLVTNRADVDTANDGDDWDSDSVTVNCPDVTVSKTAVEDPISAGDPIAFDIVVTNLGPGTAYDVTLTDTLPAGISWTENSDDCSIVEGVLSCDFGDLAMDATASVRVSGETDAADCGLVSNTASVAASNEAETDTDNNDDSDSVTVNCPDVTVSKTAVEDPISAGDPIAFDIVVTNLGPGTAYDVTLTDTLPAGISWTENSDDCSIVEGVLSCDFGDLAMDATASVRVSGETDAADCGLVSNTASVAASNEAETDTDNNDDSDSVTVNCPDVTVSKTAVEDPISAGDPIAFDIVVTNLGPGTAYDVTLTDTLPAGISWTENSDDCSIVEGVLSCDFGDLAMDATASVRVSGETDAADCGLVSNTASVAASNEAETDTDNNDDSDSVTVNCPDISLTKTADDPEVLAGDGVGFVITVSNNGDGTAYGVTVTDTLPTDPGLSWTIDAANSDAGWSISAGELGWGPGTLASGESISVRIVSPTTTATCGDIYNYAEVTTTNDGGDDDDSTIDVYCPDIEIVKTAGDAADGEEYVTTPGGVIFTYVVENTGTIDLVNVFVVDDNATPSDTSDDVTLTCPKDALAAGETMTCTATLPVDFGVRTNIAEVIGNPSIDETVEVSDEDDAVVRVPDLTIDKSFTGNTGGTTPGGDPEAKEGDVLTYTLAYDLADGPVTNGVITDTLPLGLSYVIDSATGNDEFSFVSWDAATRTLTWSATTVTTDGTVTYQVSVASGADELVQPLINVAEIDSDETDKDDDDAKVFVEPPPLAETATPNPTLPPTTTIDQGSSQPGPSLLLVLAALAGVLLAVGYIRPTPARAHRRTRRDR
jgi:uncharacterized repeat protein (TIGR01451 family)